jgi:hypothetical protein
MNNLEYLLVCCICPTIKRHNYEYILEQSFFDNLIKKVYEAGYKVSHGYCHSCKEQEMAKIKEYYAIKRVEK